MLWSDRDDCDEPEPSAIVAPAASSTDRYEEAGKVLFEKTFMELAAEAQQIPEAHKEEQFYKMLAAHITSFKDQSFKSELMYGLSVVEYWLRSSINNDLKGIRESFNKSISNEQPWPTASSVNRFLDDGEVDKPGIDDEGNGFRDIDNIESDSEGSAGGQNSDAAGPIATGPKGLTDDSESDSDLEILGDKTDHGTSYSLNVSPLNCLNSLEIRISDITYYQWILGDFFALSSIGQLVILSGLPESD
ncbi:MAG: hypothetical protein OHK93_003304 [Ramalina farinacea]|uniref:Uncharacterized protein n=1 Tax=Ramalina farinacea TaxID=258253 RepID=A0AA43U148_9LECA|nr:hypothetical protein [Ramalina farinacea]